MTDTTTPAPLLVVPLDRAADHFPPKPRVGSVLGSAFQSETDGRLVITDGRLVIMGDGCRAAAWRTLVGRAKAPHEVPHATHDHLRKYLAGWQEAVATAKEWRPTHVTGHPSAWARGATLVRVADGEADQYGVDLAKHQYIRGVLKGCARVLQLPRNAFGYVDKAGRLLAVCMAMRITRGSGLVKETTADTPEAQKTSKAALLRADRIEAEAPRLGNLPDHIADAVRSARARLIDSAAPHDEACRAVVCLAYDSALRRVDAAERAETRAGSGTGDWLETVLALNHASDPDMRTVVEHLARTIWDARTQPMTANADEPAKETTTDAPEGAQKTSKAALLRAIAEKGCELVAAVHRRPLADIVADALRADGPSLSPCPVSVSGYRIARTLPDGRVSHAELGQHTAAYRVGRHMWVAWSEYPAEPGQPAHTVALVYNTP